MERDKEPPQGVGSRGRPPRWRATQLMAVVLAVAGVGLFGTNGWTNHQAHLAVQDSCGREDQRLEAAIADTQASGLPVFDWMETLYRARRLYVRELCDATAEQLTWWRWNLNQPIEVDVTEATKQEVSAALERAAAGCHDDIAHVERLFAQRGDSGESPPALLEQVTAMLEAHRQACGNLQSSLAEARLGYWPSLSAAGPEEVSDRLERLMPQTLPFGSVEPVRENN